MGPWGTWGGRLCLPVLPWPGSSCDREGALGNRPVQEPATRGRMQTEVFMLRRPGLVPPGGLVRVPVAGSVAGAGLEACLPAMGPEARNPGRAEEAWRQAGPGHILEQGPGARGPIRGHWAVPRGSRGPACPGGGQLGAAGAELAEPGRALQSWGQCWSLCPVCPHGKLAEGSPRCWPQSRALSPSDGWICPCRLIPGSRGAEGAGWGTRRWCLFGSALGPGRRTDHTAELWPSGSLDATAKSLAPAPAPGPDPLLNLLRSLAGLGWG